MAKKELILATKPRYLKSSKKEKGKILDEFCFNTGYNRSYAIQIFQADYDYNRIARGGRKKRKRIYSDEVIHVAIKVWEILDYPCGARLKYSLMPMIESMIRFNEITVSKEIISKLRMISSKTLDRRLSKER